MACWQTGYARRLAAYRLHALPAWRSPAATRIELAQGSREEADLARLKKGLAARRTEIMPITPAISARAAALIDALALSHGTRLAAALIGATAIATHATLITVSDRHFSAVEGLTFEAYLP